MVRKYQLEPDMEQQTGSKLGKDFIKAVYCHSAYLTYMQQQQVNQVAMHKKMHCNSPIYSSSNNFINSKNIETYADYIPLLPWLHMGWYHISGDWAGLGPKVGLWWDSGTWEDVAGSAPP